MMIVLKFMWLWIVFTDFTVQYNTVVLFRSEENVKIAQLNEKPSFER